MLSIFWRPLRHCNIFLSLLARSWGDITCWDILWKTTISFTFLPRWLLAIRPLNCFMHCSQLLVVSFYLLGGSQLFGNVTWLPAVIHVRQVLRYMAWVILLCQAHTGRRQSLVAESCKHTRSDLSFMPFIYDKSYHFSHADKLKTEPLDVQLLNWSVFWSYAR